MGIVLLGAPLQVMGSSKNDPSNDVRRLYNGNANTRAEAEVRLRAAGPSVAPLMVRVVCERNERNFESAWPIAAKLLGEWKTQDAARCLVPLVGRSVFLHKPVAMVQDETLAKDEAFTALVKMGDAAVPAIRARLPFLGPEQALIARRVF